MVNKVQQVDKQIQELQLKINEAQRELESKGRQITGDPKHLEQAIRSAHAGHYGADIQQAIVTRMNSISMLVNKMQAIEMNYWGWGRYYLDGSTKIYHRSTTCQRWRGVRSAHNILDYKLSGKSLAWVARRNKVCTDCFPELRNSGIVGYRS